MLHVLVGVGQVLYAYNLELKEGNVPNEFGTANLTFFFFFPLFTWSFSSCVSLQSLLQEDCRQDWIPKSPLSTYCEVTLAGQTISVVLKGHPVSCTSGWLLKELFLEGVCTLGEPLPVLPFPLPPLSRGGCFVFLPWEPRQEPARELKACRSSCRDSVLYRVLVHLGFVNFPNCRKVLTLKDLYLLCQSKT